MILRSDAIRIHREEPKTEYENRIRGVVMEINSSEFGMEIMVDAGEKFYVDLSVNDFKNLNISEKSEAWITFPAKAGIVLQGS